MDESYSVVLTRVIADPSSTEQLKNTICQLFKLDESKLATLFAGKSVALRHNLNKQQALKLRAALAKVGVISAVRPMVAEMLKSAAAK